MEELPEDWEDGSTLIAVPTRRDLDLGRDLAFYFIGQTLPSAFAEVQGIFHRRGVYRRFKDLLERADLPPDWYAFEHAATLQASREWVESIRWEVYGAKGGTTASLSRVPSAQWLLQ